MDLPVEMAENRTGLAVGLHLQPCPVRCFWLVLGILSSLLLTCDVQSVKERLICLTVLTWARGSPHPTPRFDNCF